MTNNPESYYTNLLNIFIKHFNDCSDNKINLFHGIEMDDNTNEIMEEFFEHINQFKEATEYDKKIFAPDEIIVDEYEQLFELRIDGCCICYCAIIIPLMDYVAREIDWVKTNWKIIPIKMS